MSRKNKTTPVTNYYYLYVARDKTEYDEDGDIRWAGKLHIFYDTPLWNHSTQSWDNARQIGGEIPRYMFPKIKEGTYQKFIGLIGDDENKLPKLLELINISK